MNTRMLCLILLAGFVAVPASRAAAGPQAKPPPASTEPVRAPQRADQRMHAVALSYRAQYLAWIAPRADHDRVMIAGWDGSHAHVAAIPGDCSATGIRWAPNWNKLAVLTRCSAGASGPANAIHGALWVLDMHAGPPARKLATLDGSAACLQWTADGEHVAFLYAPEAAHAPAAPLACARRSTTQTHQESATWHVAEVSATGGAPTAVTPPSLNVYTYRLSPWGSRVVYTATPVSDDHGGANVLARLYVQDFSSGSAAAPRLLLDPATASGFLHGQWIAQPRWSPSAARVVFLAGHGGSQGLAARTIYSIPASGGTADNLTAESGDARAVWVRFLGNRSLLVTRMAGGRVELVRYRFTGGFVRPVAKWFSVPRVIGNGRELLAVSLAGRHGRRAIAYAERHPGHGYRVHSGMLMTSPPPVVAQP